MRGWASVRLLIAFAVPLAGFTVIWLWLSPEANFAARFQYPLLPIAALSWYPLLAARPDERGIAAIITRSPLAPFRPRAIGLWHEMVQVLQGYVEQNGYVLAAIFGRRPDDTHYYWVAPDLPECVQITCTSVCIRWSLPFLRLEGGYETAGAGKPN